MHSQSPPRCGATFNSVSSLNVCGRGVSNASLSQDGTFLATYGKQRGAYASLWSTDRLTEEFSFGKSSAFKNSSGFNVKFGGQFLAKINFFIKDVSWAFGGRLAGE